MMPSSPPSRSRRAPQSLTFSPSDIRAAAPPRDDRLVGVDTCEEFFDERLLPMPGTPRLVTSCGARSRRARSGRPTRRSSSSFGAGPQVGRVLVYDLGALERAGRPRGDVNRFAVASSHPPHITISRLLPVFPRDDRLCDVLRITCLVARSRSSRRRGFRSLGTAACKPLPPWFADVTVAAPLAFPFNAVLAP